MKQLKLTVCLLFLAIINTSCEWFYHDDTRIEPSHTYSFYLSFQDTSGNDLISGIEFDYFNENTSSGEVSNSDVFFLNKSTNFYGAVYTVSINKFDYFYVRLSASSPESSPALNKITFKLKCPYIFEDNSIHEIVTYWAPESKNSRNHVCYSIEYDGKDITEFFENKATVILER